MVKSSSYKFCVMAFVAVVAATSLTAGPQTKMSLQFNAYAQSSSSSTLASNNICPSKNVQHWDKIVFTIKSPQLAAKVKLPLNSELDIKVRDDPTKVADLKQKVLDFLKVPTEPKSSIDILHVRYAIICAE